MSKLGQAVSAFTAMMKNQARDRSTQDEIDRAGELANQEVYQFFLRQGASVFEARLWADLFIKELRES